PAADTGPPPDARTGVPSGTAISMPGCDSSTTPGRTWPRVTNPWTSRGQCKGADGPLSYRLGTPGNAARIGTARIEFAKSVFRATLPPVPPAVRDSGGA